MNKLNMSELMALTGRLEHMNILVVLLDLNQNGKVEEFLNLIMKRDLLDEIRQDLSR